MHETANRRIKKIQIENANSNCGFYFEWIYFVRRETSLL